jgi:hypothetical protein
MSCGGYDGEGRICLHNLLSYILRRSIDALDAQVAERAQLRNAFAARGACDSRDSLRKGDRPMAFTS